MESSAFYEATGRDKHADGKSAKDTILSIDVVKLIQLIAEVAVGEKTVKSAAQEFSKPLQTAAKVFAKEQAEAYINSAFAALGLQKLSKEDFAKQLVVETQKAAKLIRQFFSGAIGEEELFEKLGHGELQAILDKTFSALGVPGRLGKNNMSEVMNLPPFVLAFTASMAAYQELRKALDDLSLAKEERARIEEACRESVSLIRRYRKDMERIVNQYLTEHLETFETGFMAMDKALIENDVDGYIKANAEIQSILGHHMQFGSQEEFDLLMDSDETFRL